MKSIRRAVVVSAVVGLAAVAAMEGLAWYSDAPTAPPPECEALASRWDAKTEVVDALRRGDLTLAQAAARFRDIGAGAEDGEELCRQVIRWAASYEEKEKARALVSRLEEELDEHMADNSGDEIGS